MGFTPTLEELIEKFVDQEFLIPKYKIRNGIWAIWKHNWIAMIRKSNINSDLKRGIYGCFLWAYLTDTFILVLLTLANLFYVGLYFNFQGNPTLKIPWIGILYINLLYLFFLVRYFRDIYQISLRGTYRSNYLKLWWINLVTLNILGLIGSWLAFCDKSQIGTPFETEIKFCGNLRSQIDTRRFYKLTSKIEFSMVIIFGSLFLGSLTISFINLEVNNAKILFIIIYTFVAYELGESLKKVLGLIILRRVLKDFVANQSDDLLITSIRLIWYIFGYVYVSAFINILCRDETTKNLIFEQW